MYKRLHVGILRKRLKEPNRFIQVVIGPRQTGKTTLVRQALEESGLPWHYVSADEPMLKDISRLIQPAKSAVRNERFSKAVCAAGVFAGG